MALKTKRYNSKGGVGKPTKKSNLRNTRTAAAAHAAALTTPSENSADERVQTTVETTAETTSSNHVDASVQTTPVNYADASVQTAEERVETTAGITVPLDGYRPDLNPQRVSLAEEFRGTVPDEDLSLFVELWMGFNNLDVRADSPLHEA